MLGAFEEMVLLAVLRHEGKAYAVTVRRTLHERTGRDVSMGAVYATLDRLEAKGLLTFREESQAERGNRPGRPRQFVETTDAGVAELARTRAARGSMWRGIALPDASGEA